MKQVEKLGQLTTLRFFAAAMVVSVHMSGLFGIPGGDRLANLNTGVSFFFVLSGFILAHVYPDLRTTGEKWRFLRARFARIWPAHVATFLLVCWLLWLPWDAKLAVPNLLLLHAWNPSSANYFSYNSPSWSISTEFLFYLAFPFLISDWDRRWKIRTMLSGVLLLTIIAGVNVMQPEDKGLWAIYINPASRMFEFIFGMVLQLFWRRHRDHVFWSSSVATVLEIAALGICVLSVYLVDSLANLPWFDWSSPGAGVWLNHSGCMFSFGLAIYVLAMGRGWISRLLARPWGVVLGDISFSIYLIHHILLRFYRDNILFFPRIPDSAAFALFWLILLFSSYVLWSWVEMPARRFITGTKAIQGGVEVRQTWRERLLRKRAPIVAGTVLACLILPVRHAYEGIRTNPPSVGLSKSKARSAAVSDRLALAIQTGDMKALRWALDSGADPNYQDRSGLLPLVQASWLGSRESAELLLNRGADPNLRNHAGMAPVMAAVMQGHAEILRLLVSAGGDVDARNGDGETPLMEATWKGESAVVEMLVSLGANVAAARNDGQTALTFVAQRGGVEIARNLIRHGAEVNGQAKDGTTPLMLAAWNGDRPLVQLLIAHGADANIKRADGFDAIGLARSANRQEIVAILLAAPRPGKRSPAL